MTDRDMPRALDLFRVDFPVVRRWRDEAGRHEGPGVTRNISAEGMFVEINGSDLGLTCPLLSAIVRCELVLPSPDVQTPDSLLGSVAVGRVIREEGITGFAMRSKAFLLRELQS